MAVSTWLLVVCSTLPVLRTSMTCALPDDCCTKTATLHFDRPVHVAPARGAHDHPTYAAGFHTLQAGNATHGGSYIGVSGADGRAYASTDGAETWHLWGSNDIPNQVELRGTLVSPRDGILHDSGWVDKMERTQPLRVFRGSNVTYFEVNPQGAIVRRNSAEHTRFGSLPTPLACEGSDCFWTSGSSAIRLPDGSWLQTTVIPWLGGEFGATPEVAGVYAWRSTDTLMWNLSGIVATASQFPNSGEGPNENSISIAADGHTIVAVIRMDGGDGLRWGNHRTKNYYRSESRDWGHSWTTPTEMRDSTGKGIGCARPRLLSLGSGGPLLLSGGRLTTEDMTGIFVWVSSDGLGRHWDQVYSLGYTHNLLEPSTALRFPNSVNTTLDLEGCTGKGKPYPDCPQDTSRLHCSPEYKYKNCSTTGYTSLLRAGNDSAVVVYDGPSGIFSMRLTWSSAVKSDDSVAPSVVKAWRTARFDIETIWNVTYAQGLNCNGVGFNSPRACKPMELQLDVHFPARNKSTGATPPATSRPAVVFFHGGGWQGGDRSGAGGQIYMRDNMFRWASRGFVVFNVDYRLGTDPTEPCPAHDDNTTMGYSVCGNFPACCEGPSRHPGPDDSCQLGDPKPTLYASASRCPPIATSYPASRDAKAAVRYVRAHALQYGISTEHIIAAGCSAGGWTATTLAIAAEADFKDELSVAEDPTLLTTNLEASSSVAAAVVMSGGPQAFDTMAEAVGADFMSPYDQTDAPMIVLHGDSDPAVNVSNAYRSWRAYNRTGVLFEAHIFPATKHCEKDVESEESVQKLSIPFVSKATGIVLKD